MRLRRFVRFGLTTAAVLSLDLPVTAQAALSAGAGKASIAIDQAMLPLDGFGVVHDALQVRVVLLANDSNKVAIAVLDQTSIFEDAVNEFKQVVSRVTGVSLQNVLIVASHTFAAPHMFLASHMPPGMTMAAEDQRRSELYHRAQLAALASASNEAAHSMRAARVRVGTGVSDVNVNRNVPMADGWWLGANPAGPSDKQLAVVRLEDERNRPIAFLVNYAVQSAVMDHSLLANGTKPVTADLGGAAVRALEDQSEPGSVAMFLTGAAGDQLPGYTSRHNLYDKDGHFSTTDLGGDGFALLQSQGERLGQDAMRASQAASAGEYLRTLRIVSGSVDLDAQTRPKDLQQIRPTHVYAFHLAGKTQAPFVILQIGDVALVGVQAELSASTGEWIRAHSPFTHTLVVTMVNGAAKYMPPADDYHAITYEAMNSSYGPGSAEILASAIEHQLTAMHATAVR